MTFDLTPIRFLNQVVIPSTDFVIDAPHTGVSSGGVLATIGTLAGAAFTIVLVIWVGISIWAALTIIRGSGDAQAQEKGFTMIKNIWMGISSLFVFFVILSMIGTIFGFGSVYSWSENFLLFVSGYDGFYFAEVETKRAELIGQDDSNGEEYTHALVFCCPEDSGFDNISGWEVRGWANPDLNNYNRSILINGQNTGCEFYDFEKL